MITIFTPTYNRAHLLPQAYNSLCAQTCKDFEWVIVDDGSSDNTEKVINDFIAENKIAIQFHKKVNGGKHTAINLGVQKAKGDLFWILDSDDSLPIDAIERLLSYTQQMKQMKAGGICGYMAHHCGEIIGKPTIKETLLVSSLQMRYEMGIKGDMMEVFKTNILKKFPFPEIDGERFCPEVLVWYRIAQQYKLLLIPDIIYYRDYLEGGLTDNIIKIRMKSPICTMMTYSEIFELNISFKQKLKSAINYWRFAFCAPKRTVKITSWGKLIAPLGLLMHLKDKYIIKL